MHAQEVYLHPYCLVVTRYTYLPWVIPAGVFFSTTGWNNYWGGGGGGGGAEHVCGFLLQLW